MPTVSLYANGQPYVRIDFGKLLARLVNQSPQAGEVKRRS
jgi:hypothetical protein